MCSGDGDLQGVSEHPLAHVSLWVSACAQAQELI